MAGRPLRRARLAAGVDLNRTCGAVIVTKRGERYACATVAAIGDRCAHHFQVLAAEFARELEGLPLVPVELPDVDYGGLSEEQLYGVGLVLQARENRSVYADAADSDEELVLQ